MKVLIRSSTCYYFHQHLLCTLSVLAIRPQGLAANGIISWHGDNTRISCLLPRLNELTSFHTAHKAQIIPYLNIPCGQHLAFCKKMLSDLYLSFWKTKFLIACTYWHKVLWKASEDLFVDLAPYLFCYTASTGRLLLSSRLNTVRLSNFLELSSMLIEFPQFIV